jgi:hypothetical protein
METRRVRLGDVLDDYCSRCRLIMNHGVVGMVGEEVKKVRCNTCMWEHAFRHGQIPAGRRKARSKLFEEVLKGIPGSADTPAAAPPQPQSAHRKLYTIHRVIGKTPGKGPKKT